MTSQCELSRKQDQQIRSELVQKLGIDNGYLQTEDMKSFLVFAEENKIDPGFLSSLVSSAIYDILHNSFPQVNYMAPSTTTHDDYYKEGISLLRRNAPNRDSIYTKIAVESFKNAEGKALELEEEQANFNRDPKQKMSAFYKFLQGFAYRLKQIGAQDFSSHY